MRTCLICDDHALMRKALAGTVQMLWPQVQVTQAADFVQAQQAANADFDMCIADLIMPGAGPLEGICSLLAACPSTPLLVITATDDLDLLMELVNRGVAGFASKTASTSEIEQAIQQVFAGEHFLPAALNERLTQQSREQATHGLTRRQVDVLKLVHQGLSNKEIARELGLAPATIKTYLKQVMFALDTRNRTETAFKARTLNLL